MVVLAEAAIIFYSDSPRAYVTSSGCAQSLRSGPRDTQNEYTGI